MIQIKSLAKQSNFYTHVIVVEEALHKHRSTSSKRISSIRIEKLRRRAIILEQPNIIREGETELNSISLNIAVEDTFTFQSETESYPLNESNNS